MYFSNSNVNNCCKTNDLNMKKRIEMKIMICFERLWKKNLIKFISWTRLINQYLNADTILLNL